MTDHVIEIAAEALWRYAYARIWPGVDTSNQWPKVQDVTKAHHRKAVRAIFDALNDNHVYVVGTGAKHPKPEPPPLLDRIDCSDLKCTNPDHYELRA